jgi:uncharacterized FlaG/YvyC family protein
MAISAIASTPLPSPGNTGATGSGAVVATPAVTGVVAPAPAPKTAAPQPVSKTLAQAVKQVNDNLSQNDQNLYASFGKDKATGIDVITFTDSVTHEVVSQIPSKAMIALAQSLDTQGKIGQGQLINNVV